MLGTLCSHYVVQSYGTQAYCFNLEEYTTQLKQHFGPWPDPDLFRSGERKLGRE